MPILIQFVLRLSFGTALAMAITPSRLVTSGYYRVHLYALLGLNVLASMAAYLGREQLDRWPLVIAGATTAAALSYVGSAIWLYEKARAGTVLLYLVALAAVVGAALATPWQKNTTGVLATLAVLDLLSSGLLLGVTMAAMLLGHWYLNTPTMQLVPLKRLVALMAAAVIVRTILAAVGLSLEVGEQGRPENTMLMFLLLRWLAGLLGTMMLAIMAWQTLKVPNTQSATGILYVGVITTFLGEMTSELLSVHCLYPL